MFTYKKSWVRIQDEKAAEFPFSPLNVFLLDFNAQLAASITI